MNKHVTFQIADDGTSTLLLVATYYNNIILGTLRIFEASLQVDGLLLIIIGFSGSADLGAF
jgi:hypothetical protein